MFKYDLLALEDESILSNSESLLKPILKKGKLVKELPELNEIQRFYNENITNLPDIYKSLDEKQIDSLKISDKLSQLANSLKEKHA